MGRLQAQPACWGWRKGPGSSRAGRPVPTTGNPPPARSGGSGLGNKVSMCLRLAQKTAREYQCENHWVECGLKKKSGGGGGWRKREISRRSRKDVFNLEFSPKGYYIYYFQEGIVHHGKSLGFGVKLNWVQFLTLLITSCVILGKSLNPSEPHFSHQENEYNNKQNKKWVY